MFLFFIRSLYNTLGIQCTYLAQVVYFEFDMPTLQHKHINRKV